MRILAEAVYTLSSGGIGVRQDLALGTLCASVTNEPNAIVEIYNTSAAVDAYAVRLVRDNDASDVAVGVYIPAQGSYRMPVMDLEDGRYQLLGDNGATCEVVVWADTAGA